jgi:hypothetical protein
VGAREIEREAENRLEERLVLQRHVETMPEHHVPEPAAITRRVRVVVAKHRERGIDAS